MILWSNHFMTIFSLDFDSSGGCIQVPDDLLHYRTEEPLNIRHEDMHVVFQMTIDLVSDYLLEDGMKAVNSVMFILIPLRDRFTFLSTWKMTME